MRDIDWEQIKSEGYLVYWRRVLPDGSWLAVTRGNGAAKRKVWTWTHRGPGHYTDGPHRGQGIVRAKGGPYSAGSTARKSADRYATTLTQESVNG